jgi:hypothetical protein
VAVLALPGVPLEDGIPERPGNGRTAQPAVAVSAAVARICAN